MRSALVIFATLFTTACETRTHAASIASPAALDSVRAAEQASVHAWNRGDLRAHTAVYADTGTGGPPFQPGGRARAEANLARYFADPRPTLAVDSLQVSPLGAAHILASGRFTLAGPATQLTGWFTQIWARLPDGWRIVYEHTS